MIETISIKRILDLKFNFKTQYTKEEYEQITSITIERIDNDKTLLPINFKEILLFPNLQKLHINNCILDKGLMEILELSKIKELYLTNCEIIESIETIIFALPIEKLLIDNTNLKINEEVRTNIPFITISNTEVPLIFMNSKEVNLSKSNINDSSIFSLITTETIIVSEKAFEKYKDSIKELTTDIKVVNKYNEVVEEEKYGNY